MTFSMPDYCEKKEYFSSSESGEIQTI